MPVAPIPLAKCQGCVKFQVGCEVKNCAKVVPRLCIKLVVRWQIVQICPTFTCCSCLEPNMYWKSNLPSEWLVEMVNLTPAYLILAGGLHLWKLFRAKLCLCLRHSFMSAKMPWIMLFLRILLRIPDTVSPLVKVDSLYSTRLGMYLVGWIQQ